MVGGLIIGSYAATQGTSDTGDVAVVTQTETVTGTPTATGTEEPTGTATGSATPTATETPGPKQYEAAPELTIDTKKTYFATIRTTKGDIRVQLDAVKATQTVNSFVFLAREGYFDGVTFDRVLPGFVAQVGKPSGLDGPGYTIPDESNDLKHETGVVAMAKPNDPQTGLPEPNSAGAEFYITFAPQPSLDGTNTVFGKVVTGMEVLQQLVPRDPSGGGDPPPGDTILTITIEEQ